MRTEVLRVEGLSKNYGKIQALKSVSFSVPGGTVFGILGPNGSGKTTLLGLIMDVLKPNGGSFKLFGETPTNIERKKIGTLLETPNFYHYLNAVQNLRIAAEIKGRGQNDIDRVLEIVNLTARKNSRFSTYSLGMKQRLAIASALLGDPEVLVLDEPTNGLDPVGIAEIRQLIRQLSQSGKTIIMASHLLDEVEKVCTHVAILKMGTLITSGDVNEILVNEDLAEISSSDNNVLKEMMSTFPGVIKVDAHDGMVRVFLPTGTADLGAINAFCFSKGVTLNHLHLKKKSLETKFFELTN
jgi:ABC-2 type transport system ATP-binding protein